MRKSSNGSSSLLRKSLSHSSSNWILLTTSSWVNFDETLRMSYICYRPRREIFRDTLLCIRMFLGTCTYLYVYIRYLT